MDTSWQFNQPTNGNTSKSIAEVVRAHISTSNSNSNSIRNREMQNISFEISKYPRDLLQRFSDDPKIETEGDIYEDEDDDDGLNLGLGLSLGGKFGVNKSHIGLIRSSSSLAMTIPLSTADATVAPPPVGPTTTTLVRSSSLPLETEEEWRKRKKMQTLRRMEAKRRRSEKQRNFKEGDNNCGDEKRLENFNIKGISTNNLIGSSSVKHEVKGRRSTFGSLQGFLTAQDQQGCELETKSNQGSNSCGEARSPASSRSVQERANHETTQRASMAEDKSVPKQSESGENNRKEDMPCVFTIGDGPNGRKVEGILYKYGKGEEVRIMCVCHGSFFSPADFVKHAGSIDVEHPLRHIVVSPSPPFS